MNRRGFLSGLFASGAPGGTLKAPKISMRTPVHGPQASLLGFGMMRLPTTDGGTARDGGTIDQEKTNRLVDRALAAGVNYFDTSPVYCAGQCERVTGLALSRHPREKYLLAAKLSNFNSKFWPLEKSREMFATSLRELKTDYIDFYLLHSIGGGGMKNFALRYLDNGALDWLVKERERGRIRNLGFSFHGAKEVWDWAMANHGKYHWDFVQIQMNYVDWHHAATINARNINAEKLYRDLEARNIPAVVMEPLLGGRLARFNLAVAKCLAPYDPASSMAKWAFRFAGSPEKVLTVLTGISCAEHLEEDIEIFSPLKPLSDEERRAFVRAGDLFVENRTVPCTECAYCMPCPYGLDIPTIFGVYNSALVEKRLPDPDDAGARTFKAKCRRFLGEYESAIEPLRRAEHCTGCARCVGHCPQAIDIPREIRKIDELVRRLKDCR